MYTQFFLQLKPVIETRYRLVGKDEPNYGPQHVKVSE